MDVTFLPTRATFDRLIVGFIDLRGKQNVLELTIYMVRRPEGFRRLLVMLGMHELARAPARARALPVQVRVPRGLVRFRIRAHVALAAAEALR